MTKAKKGGFDFSQMLDLLQGENSSHAKLQLKKVGNTHILYSEYEKIHCRFTSVDKNSKYLFDINENTIKHDFALWICGSINLYYLIPIKIIKHMYKNETAYLNGHNKKRIVVCNIDENHNVRYSTDGDIINIKPYLNSKIKNIITSGNEENIPSEGVKYAPIGESPAHKNLKDFIAEYPNKINIENPCRVEIDNHSFPSGDRPDIIFSMSEKHYVVVEIELHNTLPGVYQLLKYKTLFCAELGIDLLSPTVKMVLVALSIDDESKKLCKRYGVEVFIYNNENKSTNQIDL